MIGVFLGLYGLNLEKMPTSQKQVDLKARRSKTQEEVT